MKKNWIPYVVLFLFLSFSASSQTYLKKHYHGDVIPLDSFVVMDFQYYNSIREGARLYERIRTTDKDIIVKYDSIINNFNNIVLANDLKLEILMSGIEKRDQVIGQLNGNIDELVSLNMETTRYVDELNKSIKKPWISSGFWIGLSIGVVSTVILLN